MDYQSQITTVMERILQNKELMSSLKAQYKDQPELLSTALYQICVEFVEDLNPYDGDIVSPEEFLNNPYYAGYDPNTGTGIVDSMHKKLQEDFIHLHNPDNHFTEAILTGGIGWGKSYLLSLGLIRQV